MRMPPSRRRLSPRTLSRVCTFYPLLRRRRNVLIRDLDFVFSLKNQVNDAEGMGGKLSSDDKETILEAIKEKSSWLDENPEAEAEDYEDQLSELQATVGVSTSMIPDCH